MKNILADQCLGPLLLHPPSLLRRGLELRFHPLVPLQLPGPPKVSSGVEGATAPRTLRGGEGDLHPHDFGLAALSECGWGVLQLIVIQPNVLHRVVGRGAAFWGVKPTPPPPLFPSSWESWSSGRAMGLPVSFHHGLSVRPPTDCAFAVFGLLAQTVALSLVSSSSFRCELASIVGSSSVVAVVRLLVAECWE